MLTNTELILGKLNEASVYAADLLRRMDDGVTVKLARNQGKWFFHTHNGQGVYLSSDAEKRAYLRYQAALVAHLRGEAKEARRHLDQNVKEPDGTAPALAVIQADVQRLTTVQPKWTPAILGFLTVLLQDQVALARAAR